MGPENLKICKLGRKVILLSGGEAGELGSPSSRISWSRLVMGIVDDCISISSSSREGMMTISDSPQTNNHSQSFKAPFQIAEKAGSSTGLLSICSADISRV